MSSLISFELNSLLLAIDMNSDPEAATTGGLRHPALRVALSRAYDLIPSEPSGTPQTRGRPLLARSGRTRRKELSVPSGVI
jgi:hypothetical protein